MKTTQEKQRHARTHKTVSSLFCRTKQDRCMCAGFSTLELLMAFVVLTLSLTAVIMLVFGNQSMAIDTELAQRGVYLAEQNLEEAGIRSHINFDNVSTTPTTTLASTPYETKIDVLDISPCAKQVTSSTFWERGLRDIVTRLSSTFVSTSSAAAAGGNCSPTSPTSDWDTPEAYGSLLSADFDGNGTGVDLVFVDGIRYGILTTDESNPTPITHNFYSIDTSDPENTDTGDVSSIEVYKNGLNGVAVGEIDGTPYAFVLNNDNSGQLQVIDLSDPTNPALIGTASSTLPNITNGIPRSIFFYDEKVYVGTKETPCPSTCSSSQNNELHIYDVSNPTDPNWPQWEDSIDVDRNVNDIIVNNGFAYLATGPGGDNTPLKVFDISSKSELVGTTFTTSDSREGTSLYLLGDKVYLGLEKGTSENDFYILDASVPSNISEITSKNLGGKNTEVGAIIVQGPFAFIGMEGIGGQHVFQVWNITNIENPWRVNTCVALVPPLPQNISGLTYSDDLIFASFRKNETFRILYDDPNLSCNP